MIRIFFEILQTLLDIIFTYTIHSIFNKELKIKRRIKRKKVSLINNISNKKYYRFKGKVEAYQGELNAPLSQENCIGYQVESTFFRNLEDEASEIYEKCVPFYLVDANNDKILVATQSAQIAFNKTNKYKTNLFGKNDENIKNFLNQFELKESFLGMNKVYKFEEGLIKEGDTIDILAYVEPTENLLKARGSKDIYITNML